MGRWQERLSTAARYTVSVFEFETPHLVIFKDWRLTVLQISFTLSVVGYVVVKSLLLWSVIQYEDVAAGFNSWCFTSWQSPPSSDAAHCNGNSSFDLAPVRVIDLGGIEAYNHSCPSVSGAEVMRQVGAEAQITVWRQKRRSSGCENAQSWDVSNVSGKPCFESFFAHGVEDLPLFLINTVSATGIGIKKSLLPCKIVDPSGVVLDTMVPEANNNGWAFTLRKLLEWAGNYNLDDFNDGNVVEIRPGTKIRLRHTGFILTVRFRYWNYKSWPEEYWDYKTFPWDWRPSEPQCSLEVELQPQAWGFTGADPDPEGSILRTVARIQFIGSGQFGEVSLLLIVTAIIEAFVLMGIASQVTLHVARCLYGDMFRQVTETSYEKVTVQKDDSPQATRSARSFFGRGRVSAFISPGGRSVENVSENISPTSNAVGVPSEAMSQRTAQLLWHLARKPELKSFDGEMLLQSYLECRLLGLSDAEAVSACGAANAPKLIEAAESAMSMLGEDDKVWDMLEKLRTGWRLEEYGFIPEHLKSGYL